MMPNFRPYWDDHPEDDPDYGNHSPYTGYGVATGHPSSREPRTQKVESKRQGTSPIRNLQAVLAWRRNNIR